MATMLALHPIPERLNVLMSSLILYLLTTLEVREGSGENRATLTTKMSMSVGEIPVLAKRASKVSKAMSSNSERESARSGVASLPSRTFLGP
ncbi:unnamed protein product [Linum tenue]|uniref:Uncharacterized protein n=1 Tax=Linum tenue TaxID=586396 RepID=A0AAV0M8Z9_9ROSI|nr:unnamed protein product [Linum tenue]